MSNVARFAWIAMLLLAALWLTSFVVYGLWALAFRYPRLGRRIRWLLDSHVRANVEYALGDLERARAAIEKEGPEAPDLAVWICNIRLIVLIACGRYREAAHARPVLKTRLAMRALRKRRPAAYGLLAINRAEALYNLGRWQRAEWLMNAIVAAGLCSDATNVQGGAAQLAWIWAQRGELEGAAFLAEGIDVAQMPPEYRAEVFFTRAFIALRSGDGSAALHHLDEAKPHLRRASSERNELFLRAWATELLGEDAAALALYEQGSACTFRGQGGDGLVRWGELLSRRGEPEAARRAWAMAIARDPESESAVLARVRLLPPPT